MAQKKNTYPFRTDRLRPEMRKKGIRSGPELADQVLLSHRQIARLLGKGPDEEAFVQFNTLKRIADFFGKPLSFFSPGFSEPSPSRPTADEGPSPSVEVSNLPLERTSQGYINLFEERVAMGEHVVGREEILKKIEAFLSRRRSGTFLLHANPGLGKTAILARFLHTHPDAIRHFIRRADNHSTPEECLQNLCAQIAKKCDCPLQSMPQTFRELRRLFDSLIRRASLAKHEGLIIVIDALDELDVPNTEQINHLGLPSEPSDGIFFVVSSREKDTLTLREMVRYNICKEQLDHQKAVGLYLDEHFVADGPLVRLLYRLSMDPTGFFGDLRDRSEYNFMYLHCVITELYDLAMAPDDEEVKSDSIDPRKLPVGLESYYEDHWKRINKGPRLTSKALKSLFCLTLHAHPWSCTGIARVVGLKPTQVSKLLLGWRMFLEERNVDGSTCFSFYHRSYQEFLRNSTEVKTVLAGFGLTLDSVAKEIALKMVLHLGLS